MFNEKIYEIKLNTKGTYMPYFNKRISVNQLCSMFILRVYMEKRRNVIKTKVMASIIFAVSPS